MSRWCQLPPMAILHIYSYLDDIRDIRAVSLTCHTWRRFFFSEHMWKGFIKKRFPDYNFEKPLPPYVNSYCELAAYYDNNIPSKDTPVCIAKEHTNEVLHVAVSHSGPFLATSSKDATVKFWKVLEPSRCFRTLYFKSDAVPKNATSQCHNTAALFDWSFTQYCEFQPYNLAGDVVLISGVKEGNEGQLAIYNISLDVFLARATISPYDILGCFMDSLHFLSGSQESNSFDEVGCNYIYINRIPLLTQDQEILLDLSDTPMNSVLHSYVGAFGSTVRRLMIAEGMNMCISCCKSSTEISAYKFISGHQPGERNLDTCTCHEKLLVVNRGKETHLSHCVSVERISNFPLLWAKAYQKHRIGGFHSSDYLLPGKDPCTSLKHSIYCDPNDENRQVPIKLSWDVDVGGHVVGMSLSPDHRFLYVNVRPWLDPEKAANLLKDGTAIVEFGHFPELRTNVVIHVLDLVAFKDLGPQFSGHCGFTPTDTCFFLYVSVSSRMVASGSENGNAVLWDRYTGQCLGQYAHSDVVNCCAFLPVSATKTDALVSVSDDWTIKVWLSNLIRGNHHLSSGLQTRSRRARNSSLSYSV